MCHLSIPAAGRQSAVQFTKPLASWFPVVPGFDWYYSTVPMKDVPQAVNGNQGKEQSLEIALYGSRQAGSFVNHSAGGLVNSALTYHFKMSFLV